MAVTNTQVWTRSTVFTVIQPITALHPARGILTGVTNMAAMGNTAYIADQQTLAQHPRQVIPINVTKGSASHGTRQPTAELQKPA